MLYEKRTGGYKGCPIIIVFGTETTGKKCKCHVLNTININIWAVNENSHFRKEQI